MGDFVRYEGTSTPPLSGHFLTKKNLTAVTGKPPKISIFHQKILFWGKFPVRGFLQKDRYFSKWFKKLPTTLTHYMLLSTTKKTGMGLCIVY